jgi:hypothetical protein
MFEKPNSLGDLSESELTSIVLSLNQGFDGSGPNPGYSWEEHFQDDSDYQGEGVPPWFKEWIKNFTSDDLLTMESHDGLISISLLKDNASKQFRVYSVDHSLECPPTFFGKHAYPVAQLSSDTIWPIIKEHFDSDESYGAYLLEECNSTILEPLLIPKEQIVAFLQNAYSKLHQKKMSPDDPEAMGWNKRISLNDWIRRNYLEQKQSI